MEGFGARELLRVGGRLPGAGGSLRFKVPESTLMDCRRRESMWRSSDGEAGCESPEQKGSMRRILKNDSKFVVLMQRIR